LKRISSDGSEDYRIREKAKLWYRDHSNLNTQLLLVGFFTNLQTYINQ
jgi:hypothetical protein